MRLLHTGPDITRRLLARIMLKEHDPGWSHGDGFDPLTTGRLHAILRSGGISEDSALRGYLPRRAAAGTVPEKREALKHSPGNAMATRAVRS
jgi:hypothetical protein